ncbi:hypothetical protein CRG98_020630 [Punica granatum]|uniref:Uncharacterized protein n=1 Tax=Punica granatum TaxID=22663 RepID=A0A2I0JRQ7_PUNGR|nr:hypothetical protein CRG98_020630 [Punica granatum]
MPARSGQIRKCQKGLGVQAPGCGKSRGKLEKGASEVGSAPWNEQTRIGAVGSTGRPDWQSGLSGLYRLIGVAFLCGSVALDSQGTKDHACGGFGRRAHVDFLEIKNKVGEKREKWRWCAVERLSARDHLVTGESESHEESLGNDGTTRHSREVVEMSGKPGKP